MPLDFYLSDQSYSTIFDALITLALSAVNRYPYQKGYSMDKSLHFSIVIKSAL